MRILMLNQAPMTARRGPAYEVEAVETLVNSYASSGTKIDIGFPDDFEGSEVFHALGAESKLNGLHHMVETPAIIRKIVWAEENGYDAVISSNTFDPGVDGAPCGRRCMRPSRSPTAWASRCRSRRMCPTRGASCGRMGSRVSSAA